MSFWSALAALFRGRSKPKPVPQQPAQMQLTVPVRDSVTGAPLSGKVTFNGVVTAEFHAGSITYPVSRELFGSGLNVVVTVPGYAPLWQPVSAMVDPTVMAPFEMVALPVEKPVYVMRPGRTRVEGRCLVDDAGALPALGTTLFSAISLETIAPDVLDGELKTIADEKVYDFVVAGTGFAGPSWVDRMADPRDQGAVGRTADRLKRFGLKLWYVIFMDGRESPGMETPEAREAVVRSVGAMLAGREDQFIAVEIVNERDKGDKISIEECQRLRKLLQSMTTVEVVTSRRNFTTIDEGSGARLGNDHFERDDSADGGKWEHLSKMSEWHDHPSDPKAFVSREPKGPGSSGVSEYNVLRLVMGYACTLIEGGAGYVFHTGPGLRSGGAWDVTRQVDGRNIPARLKDLPEWAPVSAGFRAVRANLPSDIANWQLFRGHRNESPLSFIWYRNGNDNGPFDDGTFFKWYVAVRENKCYAGGLRLMRAFKVQHKTHRVKFELVDPETWAVLETATTSQPGEWVTFQPRQATGWQPDGDGLILRGTLL